MTEDVAVGIGLPLDAVELLSPHSIPKTSSGKLRRDETRQLYFLAGNSAARPGPRGSKSARLAAT